MRCIRIVEVKNSMGLHTRPAATLVKLLQEFRATVYLKCNQETVCAKSILEILILAAQKDSIVTIIAEGAEALEATDRLVEEFENEFGEKHESNC